MAMPSYVEVPRPSSSRMTSERGVACGRASRVSSVLTAAPHLPSSTVRASAHLGEDLVAVVHLDLERRRVGEDEVVGAHARVDGVDRGDPSFGGGDEAADCEEKSVSEQKEWTRARERARDARCAMMTAVHVMRKRVLLPAICARTRGVSERRSSAGQEKRDGRTFGPVRSMRFLASSPPRATSFGMKSLDVLRAGYAVSS